MPHRMLGAWRRRLEVRMRSIGGAAVAALLLFFSPVPGLFSAPAHAQQTSGRIEGVVTDQLGGGVGGVVTVLRDGSPVAETSAAANGGFTFDHLAPGRYVVTARAGGFEPLAAHVFVSAGSTATITLALTIGPIAQHVVVTAAAADLPQARSGAPAMVVTSETLDRLEKVDILEALRLTPSANIVQTAGRGGTTSVFIRGGDSDFNKVLIDGVPANDIGGAFAWATVAATGVERVEVLRAANSVTYGADALNGVISLTTPRGSTQTPTVTYTADGGNFGTSRHALSLGGLNGRIDYFADVSRFRTGNEVPNNAYANVTGAGRVGIRLGTSTDISITARRMDADYEAPNGILYYGRPDDASQTQLLTLVGVTAYSQVTSRLQTALQFGSMERDYVFSNPAPTGEAFDPFGFGANYLGDTVTVTGANGYSVTGRAILDYGGAYPSVFESDTTRRFVSGRATYRVTGALDLTGGARIEREQGRSGSSGEIQRVNGGAFVEAQASGGNRLFATGGLGVERNGLFGRAVTPRVSLAFYARTPAADGGSVGATKLTVNAGRGIKAPSVFNQTRSLHTLIESLDGGAEVISRFGIAPIGPERSRTFDVGVEQTLAGGHLQLRAAWFDNVFTDQVEYVNKSVLPQLGVATDAAAAVPFGANVNASSFRARGLETSADLRAGNIEMFGSYAYVDAEVTASFSSSALAPVFNPAWPDIAIGQYSPLVGERPFRRPRHVANLRVSYLLGSGQVTLAGFFSGKSDGSTFLADPFFGPSMLLPNRDLGQAYQKIDLSTSWRLHPRVRWFASIENLLDQDYAAATGFPSLGAAFRSGVSVTLGGG
ncbi:MAG: TonB-dependent receptor plug domain-containing protein [Acidobacteria bacterium]|nr:TonB-dependent receptor plug domain-containing protein [Acidobacteriota bacterium]